MVREAKHRRGQFSRSRSTVFRFTTDKQSKVHLFTPKPQRRCRKKKKKKNGKKKKEREPFIRELLVVRYLWSLPKELKNKGSQYIGTAITSKICMTYMKIESNAYGTYGCRRRYYEQASLWSTGQFMVSRPVYDQHVS